MEKIWAQVDSYLDDLLAPADEALTAALQSNTQANLPAIDVPAQLGKFLGFLVQVSGSRRVLEIGTLGGYSTIWLARAVPANGIVISLELNPRHAEVAHTNLAIAGVLDRVEVRVGSAADSLRAMLEASEDPFDLIFIDADKKGLPEYLELSMKLAHPGTILVADNVVRDGKVIDADTRDPDVQGVRRFLELVAAHPRLIAMAFQTVGARGYDGFAVARVLS
jgi:predicted O-methyltransferase YrrM